MNEYVRPASYFIIFGALPVILAVTYISEFALVLVRLFLIEWLRVSGVGSQDRRWQIAEEVAYA